MTGPLPYRITEAAERDLWDIARYIAQDSLRSAERFLDRADETFNALVAMPGMGAACSFPRRPLKDIRRQPVKQFENYLVFYCAIDGEASVEIIRVIHGARDLPELFGEPEE
jgi:toxin ParE1/3/4